MQPSIRVPVTTVPKPETLKDLSIANRGLAISRPRFDKDNALSIPSINSFMPSLVSDDTP